jgi:ribose-phosphate pyrophosphokinase
VWAFSLPGFEELTPRAAGVTAADHSRSRFANGELHVRLEGEVEGADCLVVGSVAPPDEQLLSLSLLADTLVREGAANVTALLPYLGYARQDQREPGRSLAAAWVGGLLQASGIGAVVTVDVHSTEATELFPMPVTSLSPAPLFAPAIERLGLDELTVVAPDRGAVNRCEALRAAAAVPPPVAWLAKERTRGGVAHLGLEGRVSRRALVVDDILDTGDTLVSCCRMLRDAGVEEIAIAVTHGLFTVDRWKEIWATGATRLLVSDSVPGRAQDDPRVTVLPLRPLLESWVDSVRAGNP